MIGVVFLHEISIPKNQNSFLTLHGFTNIDLPMQQSIDLLRRKLGAIYPPGEIIGFTRMIFESLCGYTPTDILLHKDTILSEDIHRKIERITDRLSQQEPIQYILGYTAAFRYCPRSPHSPPRNRRIDKTRYNGKLRSTFAHSRFGNRKRLHCRYSCALVVRQQGRGMGYLDRGLGNCST